MTLQAWLTRHLDSYILQPDSLFKKEYDGLEKYDEGKMEGRLERRDSLSWNDKSWVIGISHGLFARAYDWNVLQNRRVINDDIEQFPLLIALENDSASFHVWSRIVASDTLEFSFSENYETLIDLNSGSVWDWSGRCTEGIWKGKILTTVQSYQEYWHSWKTFHPNTERYLPDASK